HDGRGRFFLFGRDHIGGETSESKRRSPRGPQTGVLRSAGLREISTAAVSGRSRQASLARKFQSLRLRRSRSSRIFFMSASTISVTRLAKVVLCRQPSLARPLL